MHQANLCLHTGANSATREQIANVRTPARTKTWVPIPHDRLLSGVQTSLENSGLHIVHEAHGLTRNGNRLFSLLQVANGDNADDFGLVVGIRNSHDFSFPVGLVVGASIFICDNLSFAGEIKLARKHTNRVEHDLPHLMDRAIGQLGFLRRTQENRFQAYKQHELTDGAAHDLIIRALDGRVVPITRIPDVLREWREPRHAEFRKSKTAWRLFNGFTETLKDNLDALPRRSQALHGLLDAACGLAVSRN